MAEDESSDMARHRQGSHSQKDLPSAIKILQNSFSWLKIWPSFLKTLGLLTKRNAHNWLKETQFETPGALNHLPWWGSHPTTKSHTVNLMCFVIHRQELVFGTYITYKECFLSPLKGKQIIHNLQLQFQALYFLRNLGPSSDKMPLEVSKGGLLYLGRAWCHALYQSDPKHFLEMET